jgi:hypothetical protein
MARWAVPAFAAVFCGCSPYGGGDFACTTDPQCSGGGVCADGFCAFPDPGCESGFRYGELSGPNSRECTGAQMTGDDAGADAPSGHCYGTGLVTACFDDVPSGTRTFGNNDTIDTDSDPMCATTTNAVPACVIAAESITVENGFWAATGSKPLVLVATQTISITGTLSVASLRQFNFVGAGADMPGCDAGTAPTGSSGGAGGSFGGSGGNGAAVGTSGTAGAALAPAMLRGGCPGQDGADEAAPTGPGTGGHGGGAVYLIADDSITVGGLVSASGAGGNGGANGAAAGGGGGGSGGFIAFDTPMLAITGNALANGGGGGEGSGNQSTGVPGQDMSTATTAAAGGAGGSSFATVGGDGSVAAQLDGESGAAQCTGTCTTPTSGGGGGGGAGIIKLYRATSASGGGGISPPPS